MRRSVKVVGALVAYAGYMTWAAFAAIEVIGIQKRTIDSMEITIEAKQASING